MFILLLVLGTINIYYAYKIKKLKNKALLAFYLTSITVVFLRCILLTDQWVCYGFDIYVLLLVSMRAYIYLLTGLSQVMISTECIIKYKNLEILESQNLDREEKET